MPEKNDYIPAGLVKGRKALVDIPVDTKITYEMLEVLDETVLMQLRRMQG